MGLCKCPKKKVTNLFCFEHRVNVCEHCLVSNHPKCVVQSYLQWLQDSDYDPACRLCGKNLSDEDSGECVRLTCYDVFHWSCVDNYARRLPANTAPAGYTCPICKAGIFPASNVASPVAEKLRDSLAKVNWARAGLGLPLIEEAPQAVKPEPVKVPQENKPSAHVAPMANIPQQTLPPSVHGQGQQFAPAPTYSSPGGVTHNTVGGGGMEDVTPYARGQEQYFNPRKLFDSTKGDTLNMSHDHDEDKYKRRSAFQWFQKWFKSRTGPARKDPNATMKRFLVVLVLGILGFLTLIIIFTRLGRSAADSDPFLDPMANPNIRVGDN